MTKRIFTFWEPKPKIPAYLEFCLESWQKFLPGYEIVFLDYSSLENWLPKGVYDDFLYKNFSYPVQTDALRCALLKEYGGIWLDLDTIITSNSVNEILAKTADFITIGPHIAFIKANKDSKILSLWEKEIRLKIAQAKLFCDNPINKFLCPKVHKAHKSWDYLGNSILNPIESPDFLRLVRESLKAMPEYSKTLETSEKPPKSLCKNYQNFYFKNDFSDYALAKNKGIILLHNSWTPEKYRKMGKDEFLNQNITLSEIFKKIL